MRAEGSAAAVCTALRSHILFTHEAGILPLRKIPLTTVADLQQQGEQGAITQENIDDSNGPQIERFRLLMNYFIPITILVCDTMKKSQEGRYRLVAFR